MYKITFVLLLAFCASMSDAQKPQPSSKPAVAFQDGLTKKNNLQNHALTNVNVYCYNQTTDYFNITLYNQNTSTNYYFNTANGDIIGDVPEGVYSIFVYPPSFINYYHIDNCWTSIQGQYADFYNVPITSCNVINIGW
ncbi:MAG TPA: hypothetical protein VF008_10205 [Niastella sp.]